MGGLLFLKQEMNVSENQIVPQVSKVETSTYEGTPDLTQMTGEQVIGLIPAALSGEYSLILDGILIDNTTDIEMVDLRGVPKLTYKISLSRSGDNLTMITATH